MAATTTGYCANIVNIANIANSANMVNFANIANIANFANIVNFANILQILQKWQPLLQAAVQKTCRAFVKLFLPMIDNNNQYIHKYIHTYIHTYIIYIYIFLTFVVYQPFKDLLLHVENSKLL